MRRPKKLPVYSQEREAICLTCEHFKADTNQCLEVTKRHPGKAGFIYHKHGILLASANCPLRKWTCVYTREVEVLKQLYNLPDSLCATLSRFPLSTTNTLSRVNAIYKLTRNLTPPPKRSEIENTIIQLINNR